MSGFNFKQQVLHVFSPLSLIPVKIVVSQTLHQLTRDIFLAFRQNESSRFETLTLYNLFSQSISLMTQSNISTSVHYCIIHRFKEEIVPFHYEITLTSSTLHLPPPLLPQILGFPRIGKRPPLFHPNPNLEYCRNTHLNRLCLTAQLLLTSITTNSQLAGLLLLSSPHIIQKGTK